MRLAVFGATGRTGKLLVEQALNAEHDVTAFVRPRSLGKLTIKHERLTVVQGDATEAAAVERAVNGADAVISVMNSTWSRKTAKTKPLTRGAQNIIDAMSKHGVRRLIITAGGIPEANDKFDIRFKLIMGFRLFMRASFDDIIGSVEAVKASDLDWTVVRMLPKNSQPTGRVNAGYVSRAVGFISRADAAAFILKEISEQKYLRQTPIIWNYRKKRSLRA